VSNAKPLYSIKCQLYIQVEDIQCRVPAEGHRRYKSSLLRPLQQNRMSESLYTKSNVRESIYQVECQRVYIPSRMSESLFTKSNATESIYQVECQRVYIQTTLQENKASSLYKKSKAIASTYKNPE